MTTHNQIGAELSKTAGTTLSLNCSSVRALAGKGTPGSTISFSDFYGKSSITYITTNITGYHANYVLCVGAQPGYVACKTSLTVNIGSCGAAPDSSGGSSTVLFACCPCNPTSVYGLTVQGGGSADSVTINLYGKIFGQGGTGGGANRASGLPATNGTGQAGGTAVLLNRNVCNFNIRNTGMIGGGGGGGGALLVWLCGSHINGVPNSGGGGAGGGHGGATLAGCNYTKICGASGGVPNGGQYAVLGACGSRTTTFGCCYSTTWQQGGGGGRWWPNCNVPPQTGPGGYSVTTSCTHWGLGGASATAGHGGLFGAGGGGGCGWTGGNGGAYACAGQTAARGCSPYGYGFPYGGGGGGGGFAAYGGAGGAWRNGGGIYLDQPYCGGGGGAAVNTNGHSVTFNFYGNGVIHGSY